MKRYQIKPKLAGCVLAIAKFTFEICWELAASQRMSFQVIFWYEWLLAFIAGEWLLRHIDEVYVESMYLIDKSD